MEALKKHLNIIAEEFCPGLFWSLFLTGAFLDVMLVLYWKVSSISWDTWQACDAHPTIQVAGTIATLIVCYLVRMSWPTVAMAAFLGGHLFSHW